jgi:hypothetical protein
MLFKSPKRLKFIFEVIQVISLRIDLQTTVMHKVSLRHRLLTDINLLFINLM